MGLNPGTKLGPYEIAGPLGAGGMGEVYRARDTRLDRSVAIKILPAHLADKAEAGERFEREARTISSLNHPSICQLYDVGMQDGVRYLVMELLEGETLAERLRRGALSLEQSLRYGTEVARGLHAAHRCGVVHRDLKPGNIMLTKTGAKLMDFGLAKGVSAPKPVSTELTATLTSSHATPLTAQGTIVGTFQYMAPEQVEGKEADARSDIFSLGAVLYETVTGKRAFEGKTLVSVAAAILEKEPEPIRTLQPLTPASLERVVKKCLAKDPDERWQNAGDLASELSWIGENAISSSGIHLLPGVGAPPEDTGRIAWTMAAIALVAAIALAALHFGFRETKPVVRTQIAAPEKMQLTYVGDTGGPPVISPDGTGIVLGAKVQGKLQLYLRSLDKLVPEPIPGSEDGIFPFWSADSHSIGFFADGKLKRYDLGAGAPVNVCDAPESRGGAWSSKGTIVFSPNFTAALMQVAATGGTPTPATKLSGKFTTHRWPAFLPDGQHFLYLAANHASASNDTTVFWASLDGKQNHPVVSSPSNAIYASGYLLYVRDNNLMARPFDQSSGEFKGEATVLNDDVQVDGSVWRGTFSASENGILIYEPGTARSGLHLTWFDRSGKEIGSVGTPDVFYELQLSPDDKRAAVVVGDPAGGIWIYDLVHNNRTRFTFANTYYHEPVWSSDGKRLAYMAGEPNGSYVSGIMAKASDGSGEEQQLLALGPAAGLHTALYDWSRDGRFLIYSVGTVGKDNGLDLWALPLFGDRKPFAYTTGRGDQQEGQFSPDGKWIVYTSNESGNTEVYVAPFPWTGAKWQISTGGGTLPRWRRDGKEIIFEVPGNAQIVSAQVNTHGSSFDLGEVRTLFPISNASPSTNPSQWSITSDGQRMLEITTGNTGALPLTVIQNWTAEVKNK